MFDTVGYSEPLLDCLSDMEGCCFVTLLGCTLIPSAMNWAGSLGEPCEFVHWACECGPVWTRANVRARRGFTGRREPLLCGDAFAYALCPGCVVCQDMRQLRRLTQPPLLAVAPYAPYAPYQPYIGGAPGPAIVPQYAGWPQQQQQQPAYGGPPPPPPEYWGLPQPAAYAAPPTDENGVAAWWASQASPYLPQARYAQPPSGSSPGAQAGYANPPR
jgi:Cys-rich protein (TIGR01571 family)